MCVKMWSGPHFTDALNVLDLYQIYLCACIISDKFPFVPIWVVIYIYHTAYDFNLLLFFCDIWFGVLSIIVMAASLTLCGSKRQTLKIWINWPITNHKRCHKSRRNYTFVNLKATENSKRCVFVLVTWPWRLPEEWPEACGSLTVVGAGTKHGFGTDLIRNPTIWLVENQNQVN